MTLHTEPRSSRRKPTPGSLSRGDAKAEGRPIRVAIVDDHPLMCSGLIATFSQPSAAGHEIEVVGTGASRADALAIAAREMPDLMVIDINIPGDGLAAVGAISCRFPAIKLIVFTVEDASQSLVRAVKAGASAYLQKGVSMGELLGTVDAVLAGECPLSAEVAEGLLHSRQVPREGASEADGVSPVDLTDREYQILRSLAQGRSNREIAVDLGLAEKTVKNYLTNVLRKLHVRNRVEAALIAAKQLL